MKTTDKVFIQGHWYQELERDLISFVPDGYYEIGQLLPIPVISLNHQQLASLLKWADEQGHLKPRLDERLRVEDLKITHRLIDIIEKQIK